mmetsp:Transcript_4848/g.17584  ORF Transcript_4848/g.17584 Transcript_4848/m.17584 type:complete len:353 (-) Transcript_4848:1340-2398(-)
MLSAVTAVGSARIIARAAAGRPAALAISRTALRAEPVLVAKASTTSTQERTDRSSPRSPHGMYRVAAAPFDIEPATGALGAEVRGLQLRTISDDDFDRLQEALCEFQVLFVHKQEGLSPKTQTALGARFGPLARHAIVKGMPEAPDVVQIVKEAYEETKFGESWHTDLSFEERPISISILRAVTVPSYGNDTLWSSMYAAYDGLSDGMKATLSGMKAVHGAGRAFSADGDREAKYDESNDKTAMKYKKSDRLQKTVEHPVVRTHPITGRKALYVNSMFTYRFAGWTDAESKPLLDFLYSHAARPEYTVRFRWKPDSVAIWDNRVVQHIALNDYYGPERRVMQRVTVEGEVPF